uniref:Olfactory receptor 67 n=1 Tax=Aulacocentrum confusum TaxID=2767324 RepID=A0A7G8Z986_9HYME|nr:olfactory receptor 67 [Aulacocentrum confusum]
MIVLSPEFLFKFTKYSVAIVYSWPHYKNYPRNEKIKLNIKWLILWLISISASLSTCYSVFIKANIDRLMSLYYIPATGICVQSPIKMIIFKIQSKKFKYFFEEMENYVYEAQSEEKSIFNRYANLYGVVHIGYTILVYLASIVTVLVSIVSHQALPSEIEYPFNVDKHPILDIIYFLQLIQLCQCSSSLAVECQMAVLLWYIAARFEILGSAMKSVCSPDKFDNWIENHQELLCMYFYSYTEEIIDLFKYIYLLTVISIIIPIIFGGIMIQLDASLALKIQIMGYVGASIAQLFIIAWPSEILSRAVRLKKLNINT